MTVAPQGPSLAHSPGLSYQQLLDTDTNIVPDVLRLESPRFLGDGDVPIDRYIDPAWHRREVELLWRRVWQFACREEHVPEPGDHVVYDIAGDSYLVIRQPDGSIRAFVNACLHRGRQLKHYDGRCSEIRCPFHGFAWRLSGELQDVPAAWDFPHVEARRDEFHLPEAQVGTWAGFVFINPDPAAAPLSEFLGELPSHFERWNLANRYVEFHLAKVVRANWKIAQEAFCEAYHVNATHPQTMPYLGDTNSQVDVWDTFARVITPGGTVSPLLDWVPNEETMMRAMLDIREDEPTVVPVPSGSTCRETAAANARERWRPVVGDLVDRWSDAEFVDNLDYTLFPNFHPWGAFNRIVYRFRPNGDDHRSSIMEVLLLAPFEGERPPPAPIRWLGPDQQFTAAPELGMLGKIFDQDLFNMERVHRGLEMTRKPGVTLGNYQESKVRWLHTLLGEWCGGGEED